MGHHAPSFEPLPLVRNFRHELGEVRDGNPYGKGPDLLPSEPERVVGKVRVRRPVQYAASYEHGSKVRGEIRRTVQLVFETTSHVLLTFQQRNQS